MNIIVLIAEYPGFDCHIIEYETNVTVCIENSIFVYKTEDHYDAIVPIPPAATVGAVALRNELPMTNADKACVD